MDKRSIKGGAMILALVILELVIYQRQQLYKTVTIGCNPSGKIPTSSNNSRK